MEKYNYKITASNKHEFEEIEQLINKMPISIKKNLLNASKNITLFYFEMNQQHEKRMYVFSFSKSTSVLIKKETVEFSYERIIFKYPRSREEEIEIVITDKI